MLRKHYKSKEFTTTRNNIIGPILVFQNKKNRRIYHTRQLPLSKIIKRRIPTTIHRFYKARQCNNDISPITHINQTQHTSPTILEKINSGSKIKNSPSPCSKLLLSKRRTRLIAPPITNPSLPTTKIVDASPKNSPSTSPSLSDRMEVDICPIRGVYTQFSPTIKHPYGEGSIKTLHDYQTTNSKLSSIHSPHSSSTTRTNLKLL